MSKDLREPHVLDILYVHVCYCIIYRRHPVMMLQQKCCDYLLMTLEARGHNYDNNTNKDCRS